MTVCKKCGGEGMYLKKVEGHGCYEVIHAICEYCHGKGEVEQTNEEWLKQASTEELAEFLAHKCGELFVFNSLYSVICVGFWVEWLKEKHN